MEYEDFLEARNIDIRTLEPEMLNCLQEQFAWAQQAEARQQPPSEVLVVPSDCCLWPARAYWLPVESAL